MLSQLRGCELIKEVRDWNFEMLEKTLKMHVIVLKWAHENDFTQNIIGIFQI